MRKKLAFTALIAAALCGNVGIATAAELATRTAVVSQDEQGKDVEVNLTKNQEISMNKGTQLKVSLEANITTGYGWEIEDFKPSLLELTESIYISDSEKSKSPDAPEICGAGGVKTFTFRAKKIGKSSITFWYKRPWMEGKPEKALTLKVKIK